MVAKRKTAALYATVLVVLAVFGVATYLLIIRPQNEADHYAGTLQQAAARLHDSFNALASTAQSAVFNDPDGTSARHLHDLDAVSSLITTTHARTLDFQRAADSLAPLPYMPFLNTYHDARIDQAHATDIVAQTNDVLTQYSQLITFLRQYYSLDGTFVTLTTNINDVSNLDSLIPSTYQVYAEGQTLAKLATAVSGLKPPPGYAALLTHAAAIYKQAAQGFDTLAYGLSINYDPYKNSGISLIEQAANQHDDTLIDIPTSLDQTSYILAQVSELPDKTGSILTSQTSGD